MKGTDLREKSVEDLQELRQSLVRDSFQNRLKNFTNRLDDTSVINKTKRDLARVLTVLHQRSLAASAPADPPAAVEAKAEAPAPAAPKKKKSSKKVEAKQS